MALMNSFYGGRRGASFVIVKNYLDVVTMIADFARGNDFTEVNYDEYVMINNPHKNHPDNGKIFRRGYDYNSDRTLSNVTVLWDNENDKPYSAEQIISESEYDKKNLNFKEYQLRAHGAEYIGCIAGPSGKAPVLKMVSYDEASRKTSQNNFDMYKTSGSYSPDNIDPGLIPGKYETEENNETVTKYNDSIQWYCTCIRNNNYEDDSQAYIGFKFPYLVTQLQASWVEPYDANGNKYDSNTIFPVSRASSDDKTHPYYNKWHLDIPKGVKGDTLKNLKVTTFNNYINEDISNSESHNINLYDINDNILLGTEEDNLDFFANKYEEIIGKILVLNGNKYNYITGKSRRDLLNFLLDKKILVYEKWNYDEKQQGQIKYYYLGDYNQIDDIRYDNNHGKIIISFSNQTDKEFSLKQIAKIQIGMDRWGSVEHQILDEEGHPIPKKDENGNQIIEQGQPVYQTEWIEQWIQDTEEGSESGKLKILYNDDSKEIFKFPWVNGITYDKDNGQLKYLVAGEEGISYPILTFKGITNIEQIKENGENFIKINYTNNSYQRFPIKMVSGIRIQKDYIIENQQGQTQTYPACLIVTYNDGTTEVIAVNFNYLESFNYDDGTGVLSFKRFTDKQEQSATLNYVKSIKYDKNNGKLTYILQNGEPQTVNANDGDSIPFIKQIDLDSNLNLYVQMSSAGSINVPQSQENYPDAQHHSPLEGWYFLGNIIKEGNFSLMNSTSFKYYSWEEYQTEILESNAINTEYTTTTPSDIAAALTAKNLDPEGTGVSSQIIAVGLPNSSKYFFGYDSDNNRWFYMTGLESDHNVQVRPYNTILDPGSGDVLLGTRTDICTITTENVSISPSLHYFQAGKPLTLKVTSVLNSNQSISVSINGTDNGSLYTYDSGIITIPNVTGDINISRITI